MALLLGLDIGSTVIKAVVVDRRGRVLASAENSTPVRYPRPGWVERDVAATWRCTRAVVRKVIRGRSREIDAIGVTGCGNGAVFLDQRLRPLRAGILASDTRARAFLPQSGRKGGQLAYPGQLPFLLAWLRKNEPATSRRLAHTVFWKDFIRARLTGVVCTDVTDAGAAGLLQYRTRRPRAGDPSLAPVRASLEPAGTVTAAAAAESGLVDGTPVFTGCIDCEAGAIGSGVAAPGEVSVVAGTWSINQTYVRQPPRHSRHFLVNPSVGDGRWLVLEASPESVASFDWARRTMAPRLSAGQAVAEAMSAARTGLLFLPRIPSDRGAFIGLGAGHRRGELLRAVMEGVVFAHRAHLERLPRRSRRLDFITLAGGAARNASWCQLFADVLGCRVEVPRGEQLGALGAAICAGVGAGIWPSLAAGRKALVPPRTSYQPRRGEHTKLDAQYRRYRQYDLRLV